MEQLLEIDRFDEATDGLDMIIDPTNFGVERSFWIMKFYESRFTSLTFGSLSALTISKFNDLPQWLATWTDEKLLEAHNSERTNQSISRNEHLIQETHMQMNTEQSLTQVLVLKLFSIIEIYCPRRIQCNEKEIEIIRIWFRVCVLFFLTQVSYVSIF